MLVLFKFCPMAVFMSPETATTQPWRDIFTASYVKENLVLVAIDEAHCISEWFVKSRVPLRNKWHIVVASSGAEVPYSLP